MPIHVKREVKVYALQEMELRNLESLNRDNSFWSSTATASVIIIIERVWDFICTDGLKYNNASIGMTVLAIGTCWFANKKAAALRKICDERLTKILSESYVDK